MNPLLISVIAGLVLAIAAGVGGYFKGEKDAHISDSAAYARAQTQAVSDALSTERSRQAVIDAAVQQQTNALQDSNSKLSAIVDGLRKRPSANNLSAADKAKCAGTDGTELSSENAVFLSGEAARADACAIALNTCYKAQDANDVKN